MWRTEWTDARLDDKMDTIESNADLLRTEVRDFRTETREEFAAVRKEMREEFAAVRSELNEGITGLRLEMNESIGGLRLEMNESIGGLRSEMNEGIGGLRRDFAALQTTLIQIGFGMVGVLLAAMIALIVAVA